MKFRAALFVFVIISISSYARCQNNVTDEDNRYKDALQDGMSHLFTMTNSFLDVIQPRSKGSILEKVATEDDYELFEIDRDKVEYFVGFLILLVVGILFVVILPLVGLIFCCCRICGNCGGDPEPYKHKHHHCREICLGVTLFLLTAFILAATICLFLTNELARKQTDDNTDGLMKGMSVNVHDVDKYIDFALDDMSRATIGNLAREIEDIERQLEELDEEAKNELASASNATSALNTAYEVANQTDRINSHLITITSNQGALTDRRDTLENKLIPLKNLIDSNLISQSCTGDCAAIRTRVDNLAVEADYSSLDGLSSYQDNVQAVVDADLRGEIDNGEKALERVNQEVEDQTENEVREINEELDDLNDSVNKSVTKVLEDVREKANLDRVTDFFVDNADEVEKYGEYVYIVGIVLACILLLIVVLNLLGLLFGCCGHRPNEDAGSCHKGHGANFLMAGVGFQFIFSWILMIIVIVLFVVGGLVQTEVCRQVVDLQNGGVIKDLDQYLIDELNISFQLHDVFDDCQKNEAIYQVLQLDSIFALEEDLNISEYDLDSTLDTLGQVTIDINTVNIYTSEMEKLFNDLINSDLQSIPFNDMVTTLSASILSDSLSETATELETYANTLNDLITKETLLQRVAELRSLESREYTELNHTRDLVFNSVNPLRMEVEGPPDFTGKVEQLKTDLTSAEDDISTQSNTRFIQFIGGFASVLLGNIEDLLVDVLHDLQYEVGRCGPLYNALDSSIHIMCVETLNPLNGFWFCLGWALFFFIPLIIIAVKLAGYYRKTDPYRYRADKDFDDPDFDRYTGTTNSTMPLQQYDRQAQGYRYTDEYTTSRSMNIRPQPISPDYKNKDYSGGGDNNPPPYYSNSSNVRFDY